MLQQAQTLFRNDQPDAALELARQLQRDAPQDAGAAAIVAVIFRQYDFLLRKAAREQDHAKVIALARQLMPEPAFALPAALAFVKAAIAGLPAAERGDLLSIQYRDTGLPAVGLDALGEALADMPPDPANLETGFDILWHLPGHRATLRSVAAQMAGLGLHAVPDSDRVAAFATDLRDRLSTDADPDGPTSRDQAFAEARSSLPADTEPAERLALELAIRQVLDQRTASGGALANNAWALLDADSDQYVLRQPPPLSAAAQAVFAAHAAQGPAPRRSLAWRGRVILSLWLRGINYEASQDRIGYVWLVLDPLVHILIIVAVPLFLHPSTVSDMPTFAFGVLGASLWMTFRSAAMTALASGGILRPQLEHPAIRRFEIILARGLNGLIVYFLVGAVLMASLAPFGLSGFPENLPLFLLLFLTVWLFGLCYGIIVTSLTLRYPGVRRINGFAIRLIAFTSGLFFVTEQLPDELAAWLLWNPVLHLVQLGRSAWFHTYETRDADPAYVLFCFLTLMVLALICLRLDERRPEIVRA